MKKILQYMTDWISTKKGSWITLTIWIVATILLTIFAPSVREFQVSSIETLPEDSPAMIASEKMEEHFPASNHLPAILVFESNTKEVKLDDLAKVTSTIIEKDITGVEEVVPIEQIPPQATDGFFSEDRTTVFIPLNLQASLDTPDIKNVLNQIYNIVDEETELTLHVTGPAGIAADTSDLFSRADLVLIFSTIGIILVLLVVIYRSPLLALIPLLGALIVYQIATQILGLFGMAGLIMSQQTVSIMSILLFAAVIDYSLFVFSRFREELKVYDNKYEAMKLAMRGTGLPLFYSGSTIFAAMLILFFAKLGDYKNFAPTFGITLLVIMIAAVTLLPALFTLFGRKSFWPMIPKVGDSKVRKNSFWSKVGHYVTKKPKVSIMFVILFILASSSYLINLKFEYDMIKSFPDDMPSRIGYDLLEEKFHAGDLAPTAVLFESEEVISEESQEAIVQSLEKQNLVSHVRLDGVNETETAMRYSMIFNSNPYNPETLDALENIRNNSEEIIKNNKIKGEFYFAGETASSVDDRSLNNRDLVVIVLLETILISIMLIFLTKSFRMSLYMMVTILVSFFAALGLGLFLTNLFFDIDSFSNRVPIYAFVFLVALGIDYNIILVSRFMEEQKDKTIKEAVQSAVASTGGVISSAGIILASTFAVLMTQPIQLLFVFGFVVAIGILIDTFLVRGVLLPGMITLFEKDKRKDISS